MHSHSGKFCLNEMLIPDQYLETRTHLSTCESSRHGDCNASHVGFERALERWLNLLGRSALFFFVKVDFNIVLFRFQIVRGL